LTVTARSTVPAACAGVLIIKVETAGLVPELDTEVTVAVVPPRDADIDPSVVPKPTPVIVTESPPVVNPKLFVTVRILCI
jgi:hypothetical protein